MKEGYLWSHFFKVVLPINHPIGLQWEDFPCKLWVFLILIPKTYTHKNPWYRLILRSAQTLKRFYYTQLLPPIFPFIFGRALSPRFPFLRLSDWYWIHIWWPSNVIGTTRQIFWTRTTNINSTTVCHQFIIRSSSAHHQFIISSSQKHKRPIR